MSGAARVGRRTAGAPGAGPVGRGGVRAWGSAATGRDRSSTSRGEVASTSPGPSRARRCLRAPGARPARLARALAVVLAASCAREERTPVAPVVADAGTEAAEAPAPEDDPKAWFTTSSDGTAVLRQKGSADQCYVTCTLGDGGVAWEARMECVAEPHHRRFVAADCGKTVVLIPAPDRGGRWADTVVMRVFEKDRLRYEVKGPAVLSEQRMATSTTWLNGTYGVPGPEPAYTEDGQGVRFQALDGKETVVRLIVEPEPPPRTEKKKRSRRRE